MFKANIYRDEVTPSSGSVVWVTPHLHGDLVSIHVKPTTATTYYSLKIQDANSHTIFESEPTQKGDMDISYDGEVLNDILTCTLSGASADEVFYVSLRIRQFQVNQ